MLTSAAQPESGSPTSSTRRRWLLQAGLIFAVWTVLALLYALQMRFNSSLAGSTIPMRRALAITLINYWIWALLTPIVLFMARRFPFSRAQWLKPLAAHSAAILLVTAIHALLRVSIYPVRDPHTSEVVAVTFGLVRRLFLLNLYEDLWMYVTVAGIYYAFNYYRRYREREMRESQLEAQLARAQLQVLRMQLQPHFLFNTLHAISTLMARDVKAAKKMLVNLSDLLRIALDHVETPEVSLNQELQFLERYLDIERIRFQDRMTVQFEVGADVLDALLPNMLLQPLVENAVRHGIAMQPGPGRITIRARRDDSRLRVCVEDNGPGLNGGGTREGGIGLSNTRARLQQLYGDSHRLDFKNVPGGGLNVCIEIPFRLERERVAAGGPNGDSRSDRGRRTLSAGSH